jgi:hypothetical protein
MDIDVDTSKESDHMKNAEERSLKSTSSSEYSYTSGTCAPGQLELLQEGYMFRIFTGFDCHTFPLCSEIGCQGLKLIYQKYLTVYIKKK